MAARGDNAKRETNVADIFEVGTSDIDVYENLLEIQAEFPDLTEQMKEHLSKRPFERIKGKYFPMKQYYAWEYRLTLKIRVYLQVHRDQKRVYIYGAGRHPKEKAPKPPKAEKIAWSKFTKI